MPYLRVFGPEKFGCKKLFFGVGAGEKSSGVSKSSLRCTMSRPLAAYSLVASERARAYITIGGGGAESIRALPPLSALARQVALNREQRAISWFIVFAQLSLLAAADSERASPAAAAAMKEEEDVCSAESNDTNCLVGLSLSRA